VVKDLLKKEDWWAIWFGFIIIILAILSKFTGAFSFLSVKPKTWGDNGITIMQAMDGNFPKIFFVLLFLALMFAMGLKIMGGSSIKKYLLAFPALFGLTYIAELISAQATMKYYGLGYALWALVIGLIISNTIKTPEWLKPALKTEMYIKTGLVLLGASVLFNNILRLGLYGLGIAWFVTPLVVLFMWYFGTRILKIKSKSLVITIATATSVCGVSAAIAAAAASKAKKDELTFAVGLSLIFTVIMMVFMPLGIKFLGMDPLMGGAWIGGTIDSTGAVAAAGAMLGDVALKSATIVKMIQNVLIGVFAFGIALFWVTNVEQDENSPRVGISEIWIRFPKFIIGFLAASILFSFVLTPLTGLLPEDIINITKGYQSWLFALAFMSIGLESNFKEMAQLVQGGKPLTLYVVGQTFNVILTLVAVWLLLSGTFFPIPVI
jgi:uncharacterized integral membrane protein (TIGR00698 family)